MIVCHTIHVNSSVAVLLLSAQITRNEKEREDDKGDTYRRLALWYEWIDAVVLLGGDSLQEASSVCCSSIFRKHLLVILFANQLMQ